MESLKKGIIKVSKNQVGAPYTILIVGETGVGKSSVLEFIANVLSGKEMSHYNFDILDRTNEQVGSDNQSKTNSARLYEFPSKSGIAVSTIILNIGDMSNHSPRFAFSTPLDWPILAVLSKTSATRIVLRLRSRSI